MIFTSIYYRPEGVDTCMGCHMGSSSSAFDISINSTEQDAITALTQFMIINKCLEDDVLNYDHYREYTTPEYIVLINGDDYLSSTGINDDDNLTNIAHRIVSEAEKKSDSEIILLRKKYNDNKANTELANIKEREQRERELYEELKRKYQ